MSGASELQESFQGLKNKVFLNQKLRINIMKPQHLRLRLGLVILKRALSPSKTQKATLLKLCDQLTAISLALKSIFKKRSRR
jgi:hypothetical protein